MKQAKEDTPNDDPSKEPCLELRETSVEGSVNDVNADDGITVKDVETQIPNRRKSSASNESVVFCQRIRQPEMYNLRNLTWGMILLILTALCIWHVCDRTQYYLSEPTSFQVEVQWTDEVRFPAMTICPAREPFNHEHWIQAFKTNDLSKYKNVTVEDIWDEFGVKESDISVVASCNSSHYCDFLNGVNSTLTSSTLYTFWGRCIVLEQDFPIDYRGLATYWAIFLHPGRYARDWFDGPAAAQFFFHEPRALHRHDAFLFADLWIPDITTVMQITLKEFYFLNLSRDPCYSEEDSLRCRNACIDEALDKEVNCSLPFMTSKWPLCKTVAEVKRTFELARNFYYVFDWTDCVCFKPCRQNMYTGNTNAGGQTKDKKTVFVVQFADNLIEAMYEEHAYSFSALISDIGGSVGVFLGLSIISVFQIFDEYFVGSKKKKE